MFSKLIEKLNKKNLLVFLLNQYIGALISSGLSVKRIVRIDKKTLASSLYGLKYKFLSNSIDVRLDLTSDLEIDFKNLKKLGNIKDDYSPFLVEVFLIIIFLFSWSNHSKKSLTRSSLEKYQV